MQHKTTAQVTYTSNPLTSPSVIAALVTIAASIASALGWTVLEDPAVQQQAVLVLGLLLGGVAHWLWPHKDGRLSFNAPMSNPTPQDVDPGTSVVTVPSPDEPAQVVRVERLAAPVTGVVFEHRWPASRETKE